MSDTLFCSICQDPYKECSCPAKGLASALQTLDALRAQASPKRPSEVKSMRYEVQLTRETPKKCVSIIEALEEVQRLLKAGEDTIFIYDHVKECPVLAIDFQSGLPELMKFQAFAKAHFPS